MKPIKILARDRYPLAATVFEGDPNRVWVIHSATGVPQRYYAAFATDMAARGPTVVTYDYRGIASSLPEGKHARDVEATMTDWALKDADGVHDWVTREFPSAEVSVVGHSFGGQILGLLDNRDRIARVLLAASQSGYWRYFATRNQPFMAFNWYVLFPMMLATLGYIPMSRFGQGEDLPGGVARQWARWCRDPEYLFSELSGEQLKAYREFRAPILAYSVTDDKFAGGEAVPRLLEHYPAERTRMREVSPNELGVKEIGHFGFFRTKFREPLWDEAWAWLGEGRMPKSASRTHRE